MVEWDMQPWGYGRNQTGNLNPATMVNDITDPTVFANVYSNVVNAMTAKGAKVWWQIYHMLTALPFFTTVQWLTASVLGVELL
jgi:hypothetical protein